LLTAIGKDACYSDRCMPASETLARVMPILGDFGITRVARHTGLDNIGIPVWCAYAPNSRSIVVAQGKGLSDDDAKASAVMEALERAVASSPAVETVRATAHALRASHHQVTPLDCLIGVGKVDIGAAEEIEWACAEELLSGTPVYVPVDAAILDRTRNCRFWISSDGLASGNILEEAILHGVLERIERDAHVLWQIGSDQARFSRCVDPEAFDDRSLDDLVRRIEAAGLVLRLFDITSDIAIPCFTALIGPVAVLSDGAIRFVEVTGGSGAHPFAVKAAIRAVTEAAQSRVTYISGARDDVSRETFHMPLPRQTRLAFCAVPKALETSNSSAPRSLSQNLERTLAALRCTGIDLVAALPLSDAALPFSVVKIFIPALENPDGARARRFGSRALSKALMA
jgi:YcaO-like protein with predicted kinase domain